MLAGVLVAWISYRNLFLISLLFIPFAALLARQFKTRHSLRGIEFPSARSSAG